MKSDTGDGCAVVVLANGFDELEAAAILSGLRRAGVQVKSVGLVSGLIVGLHGIWIRPDLTLTDLAESLHAPLDPLCIDLIVLPGSCAYLASLEPDPRVRRLIQQVVDNGGWVATNAPALKTLRDTLPEFISAKSGRILLHFPEQPVEAFVEELVLRYRQRSPQRHHAHFRYEN